MLGAVLAALAWLPGLPFGGVGEYHGEVAWLGVGPPGDIVEFFHPGARPEPIVTLPGGAALEVVGSERLLVLRAGGSRHVVTYHPFMAFFTPFLVDLWVSVPWMAALGPSLLTLKLFALVNLCLYAAAAAAFARVFLGPRTALVVAVLVAASPASLVLPRALPGPFRLQAIGLLALLALEWDRRTGRTAARAAFGFGLGFGLCNSLMFAWILAAAAGVAAATGAFQRWGRRGGLAVLAGFAAGAWPIGVYNGLTGGTFAFVERNLGSTDVGVPTLALAANARVRFEQALALFDLAPFLRAEAGLDLPRDSAALPALAVACAVLLAVAVPRVRAAVPPEDDRIDPPRARAVLAAMAAVWACTPFTLSSLGPHHVALAFPFPQFAVASAVVLAWRAAGKARPPVRRPARLAIGVALGLAVASSARVGAAWTRELARTGGTRLWTDTTAPLAAYLDDVGPVRPIAIHPQPFFGVLYLTSGRVRVFNPYGADFSVREVDRDDFFRGAVRDPRALFVRKVRSDLYDPHRGGDHGDPFVIRFVDLVLGEGGRFELVRRFAEGGGGGGFEVWRVVWDGGGTRRPPSTAAPPTGGPSPEPVSGVRGIAP